MSASMHLYSRVRVMLESPLKKPCLLRAHGMRVVKVTTGGDKSHAPARRAYEKAGFRTDLPTVTYFREL